MTKLASNYRVEVTDRQQEIFLDGLVPWSNYQIEIAMEHAMVECLFFPNLKEILDRMPADTAPHGPVKTCELCRPDGWRLIYSPTAGAPYRVAVRCDHKPEPPLPTLEGLEKLYEPARELLKQQRENIAKKPPRWPHLAGKP